MENIKPTDVLREVVRIARERRDTVYVSFTDGTGPLCRYTHNGEASCVVGHGAVAAGIPFDVLAEEEENRWKDGNADNLDAASLLADMLHVESVGRWQDGSVDKESLNLDDPEQRALAALLHIQGEQDAGVSWGAAVDSAEQEFYPNGYPF